MLAGRTIVLGVSGGIAAYKAVEVCRRLMDAGVTVLPVMTDAARRFVGEATFSALASEPVRTSMWDEHDPIPHTQLGQRADLVLVCPATAATLGRYAHGIPEDLLGNVLVATRAPVVVCPAMHTEMWEHPSVQDNLALLVDRGVTVVPPGEGRLAGGDVGAGRLAEPEAILAAVRRALGPGDLEGVSVLVTAGGTREPVDAVRVLTNRSSGKQGHALAEAAADRGATVTLISTAERPAPPGVELVRVDTAAELEAAVTARSGVSDVVLMAAAVADFRPAAPVGNKIKKTEGPVPELVLEPTTDILVALGRARRAGQVLVGFAAETDDVAANARAKLTRKQIDLIVANDVSAEGVGFEHDTNAVTIFAADGGEVAVPLADKRTVATAVLDAVVALRAGRPVGRG